MDVDTGLYSSLENGVWARNFRKHSGFIKQTRRESGK